MNIILTGASGFLGSIISNTLGNSVISVGRSPGNHIVVDLASNVPIISIKADVIVHAAGKAHIVPKTKSEEDAFYQVNVTGTRNLLEAIQNMPVLPKAFIFISSVAVYGLNTGTNISENTPLLATDPYGLSKIQAEKIVTNWCTDNGVICTVLRLPLLAGPNPPGNLGAMIGGLQSGYYFNIGGGAARKSILLAKDVAEIIIKAASIGGIYNLTDGYHPSFAELSSLMALQLGKNPPGNISFKLAEFIATVGNLFGKRAPLNSDKLKKITSDLTFDDTKARKILAWSPEPVLQGLKIY